MYKKLRKVRSCDPHDFLSNFDDVGNVAETMKEVKRARRQAAIEFRANSLLVKSYNERHWLSTHGKQS